MAKSNSILANVALSVAGSVIAGLIVTHLRDNGVDFGLMKKQTKGI